LVRAVDHDVPEQIRPDIMLWMLLAGIWFLIDWYQAHETHQPTDPVTDPVTATLVVMALHMPGHLARSVSRRLQELLINDLHEPQVLSVPAFRLIVQGTSIFVPFQCRSLARQF
jgi:hypothetical protein